jgi:hypothetical protein
MTGARPPRAKRRWLLFGVLALFAVLLAVALVLSVPVGWSFYKVHAYYSLYGDICDQIFSLSDQRPANISPEHWEEAVEWTLTAFGNIRLGSPDNRGPLEDFAAGFAEKMAAGDNLATLKWVWDELERKTEVGPRYAAEYKPVRALTPDPITDESLGNLWGWKSCENWDLRNTEISDKGLRHLADATNVVALLLDDTPVTDSGLEYVTECANLHSLSLQSTQVTDAGLDNLKKCTNLRRLDLRDTQVTEAGVRQLQESLPECAIQHGPGVESTSP